MFNLSNFADKREISISKIEEHFQKQVAQLIDEDRYADADALFSEFVIDSEEPTEWVFMEVCEDN